jgi:MFS family permease
MPRHAAEAGRSAPAGIWEGLILVATAWLAVMATSLIAPVLPTMARHFSQVPQGAALVQLGVALPALMVALLSSPVGWLTDRLGRRALLIGGLVVYAIAGLAPTWLDTLPAILISRCLVGAAEAIVMTAGTALVADSFSGAARERWFAIETGSATLVAVVVLAAGGSLGELGWRAPFFAYALPLLLAILVWLFIREPTRQAAQDAGAGAAPWRRLVIPVGTTLFAGTAFYVVVIQLPFLLTSRGYPAPAQIGFGAAIAATAVPVGSVLYRLLRRISAPGKLILSFGLSAVGFAVMALRQDYVGTLVGATINGAGSGLALPTLLTWAATALAPKYRGLSTGAWTMAFFAGQFFSPIVFLGLAAKAGPSGALLLFAAACALGLVLCALSLLGRGASAETQERLTTPA